MHAGNYMATETPAFFAPGAWVNGAWAQDVLLAVAADGTWSRVEHDCPPSARGGATKLTGPVLPGLVNAHSHAFQRAIAALTERSQGSHDDFWSWRDRMYAAALRITPDQIEAVATFLYRELLQAGYTHVCEFHYLHNDTDGRPFANPLEMSLALVRAAQAAGIGLTLLPTLYMRSGFGASALAENQRRFASTPQSVLHIAQAVKTQAGDPGKITSGVALHSLRAVDKAALAETAQAAKGHMPLHIHVAEQRREVEDCLVHYGSRPIEWLLKHAPVDAHWNLVHATQATPDELDGLRSRGASIVLCPTTEANLGDGVFNLPAWMGASGRWSVGSDSHITRSWQEELRLLEYSQRLMLRQRNVAARAALGESTAAALFEGALEGGTAAAGLPLRGLAVGQRADFLVVDAQSPALVGMPGGHVLDALVFSSPQPVLSQVYVAGRRVLEGGDEAEVAGRMTSAMKALWQ
jgi:formimidoylglutamate deiminase